MPEEIESSGISRSAEWSFGGWRVVASAWVVAIVFVVLFAGVQALASRHGTSPREASLIGAVIPRHDPTCADPSAIAGPVSDSCLTERAAIERAQADAYSGW